MKKTIAILVAALAAVSLVSCSTKATGGDAVSQDQAKAYYVLVDYLYGLDPGLNSDAKYLVLDLSEAKLTDSAPLVTLVQGFCKDHGYTLMQDTIEGLQQKGYIKDLYFADGFVIGFKDVSLEPDKLVTKAQKWRSGTGAIGGQYTLEKKGQFWALTDVTGEWIS